MEKTKIVLIGMATLLVVSLAGNVYQYTQLQAIQAQMTASTARIDELSAKLTEQSALLEKLTLEKKQLNDELAERAGLIKNLNDTISMQELALDTSIPTPDQLLGDVGDPSGPTSSGTGSGSGSGEVNKPVPPAPPAPQKPQKPAETPKVPQKPAADNGSSMTQQEIIDALKAKAEAAGGSAGGSAGGGTLVNPDDKGAIKAHGD